MDAKIFDIIILIVFAWSGYKGYTKGLIAAAASLVALFLGVWGAFNFSGFTASHLSELISVDYKVLNIIAFIVTFIGIVIGVHFLAKAIEKISEAVALGFINKLLGSAFGVLKAALIMSIIIIIINAANAKISFIDAQFKSESIFYKPISGVANTVLKYLDFDKVKADMDDIKDNVEKKTEDVFI